MQATARDDAAQSAPRDPDATASPGWRRPAVAALAAIVAALSVWGLLSGRIPAPAVLVHGAAGPLLGLRDEPAPTPTPDPSGDTATAAAATSTAPAAVEPRPVLSPTPDRPSPTSPPAVAPPGGGGGETPPPPTQPEPPAPERSKAVSAIVDPVVQGATSAVDGLTGGATGPLTNPVKQLVDSTTDALDEVVGSLPLGLGGSQ